MDIVFIFVAPISIINFTAAVSIIITLIIIIITIIIIVIYVVSVCIIFGCSIFCTINITVFVI